MAKELGRKKSPNQLKAEIARSRELVERDLRDLRSELDIPRKIRRSFRRQTGLWIAAVAVVGVLIRRSAPAERKSLCRKQRAVQFRRARFLRPDLFLGALRIAATLFRPMIMEFVAKETWRLRRSARIPRRKW